MREPVIMYDGPKVAAHIKTWHPSYAESLSNTHTRRIYDWSSGSAATIWTLDEILCALDSHLSAVPDEMLLPRRERKKRIPKAVRVEIVERYRAGESSKSLAEEFARSQSSILKMNREAAGYIPIPKEELVGKRVELTCKMCGDKYVRLASDLKRRELRGKFCSKACGHEAKRKAAAERRARDAS